MNIAKHLDRSAFFFPHRPAVSHGEFDITYRDLDRLANRIAGGLTGLGVMPGGSRWSLRPQFRGVDHVLFWRAQGGGRCSHLFQFLTE